jgi:hypothetical protein
MDNVEYYDLKLAFWFHIHVTDDSSNYTKDNEKRLDALYREMILYGNLHHTLFILFHVTIYGTALTII